MVAEIVGQHRLGRHGEAPTLGTRISHMRLHVALARLNGSFLCQGDLVEANHSVAAELKSRHGVFIDFRGDEEKRRALAGDAMEDFFMAHIEAMEEDSGKLIPPEWYSNFFWSMLYGRVAVVR